MPKVTGPLLDLYDPEASCKKNDEDIGKGSGGDEIDIDNFLVDQEEGDGEGSGRYGTIPPFPPPPPGLNGVHLDLQGHLDLLDHPQIFGENYVSLGQCGCNTSVMLSLLETAPELRGPPGPPGFVGLEGREGR
ncbi:unnamed protein product [Leptidea sinapis]|uniref:Uncharacterized protein n=1 Tax=Leptidea sinapis TaxID=189913 RepID=A0A5E4R143_9NEOP|nr:unnamed protein product [Leptidea sinapis]